MHDAEKHIGQCDAGGDFDDTSEYQLLIRLLKERTIIDENDSRRVREKEEVEEPSKVLLNPSDPQATFRYKAECKHLGYDGNVVETVGKNGDLVTDYAYEQNTYSDSQFLNDYLESQLVYDEDVTLVTGGAYSGKNNVKTAASHQIKLVTTNFSGRKPDDIYADFNISENERYLLQCAGGHSPYKCSYDLPNEFSAAYFSGKDCNECAYKYICRLCFLKKMALKEVSWNAANRAGQLRYIKSREFQECAHFRNGVEAIPSLPCRKYHVDKIPAHGKRRTRLYFDFKIATINF